MKTVIPIYCLLKCLRGKDENGDLRISFKFSWSSRGEKIKTKPICHYEGKRVSSFSIRKMVDNTGLDL